MKTNFAIGDVVKLASDGPDMTVQRLPIKSSQIYDNYECQWFAGKKLEHGRFQAEQLILVKKRDAS